MKIILPSESIFAQFIKYAPSDRISVAVENRLNEIKSGNCILNKKFFGKKTVYTQDLNIEGVSILSNHFSFIATISRKMIMKKDIRLFTPIKQKAQDNDGPSLFSLLCKEEKGIIFLKLNWNQIMNISGKMGLF